MDPAQRRISLSLKAALPKEPEAAKKRKRQPEKPNDAEAAAAADDAAARRHRRRVQTLLECGAGRAPMEAGPDPNPRLISSPRLARNLPRSTAATAHPFCRAAAPPQGQGRGARPDGYGLP